MLSLLRAVEPHLVPLLLRLALRTHRSLSPARRTTLRDAFARPLTAQEQAVQAPVARLRTILATDDTPLAVQDFGAGTRTRVLTAETKPAARTVAEIYRTAAASPAWGEVLFRIVRALRPARVLELGTNLGVSAAHLQAALALNEHPSRDARSGPQPGRLVSIEGDPTLADAARAHLADVLAPAQSTTVVTGRFDDVLPTVLAGYGPFDLVFLDGHHEEAATRRYFERIAPQLTRGACVVFDDIEPGRAVRRAWTAIRKAHPAAEALDLVKLGLLFVEEGARASHRGGRGPV